MDKWTIQYTFLNDEYLSNYSTDLIETKLICKISFLPFFNAFLSLSNTKPKKTTEKTSEK